MEKKKANKYFDRAITQCNELLQEMNRREGRPVDLVLINRQFEQFSDYTRRYCPFTHGVVSALVHFYTDIQDLTFDDNRLAVADIGAYKFQGFLRCIKKLASYLLGCQIRLYMNLDDGQGGQNASDMVSLELVSNIYTARMIEEQWTNELTDFCTERNISIEEKLCDKTSPLVKIGFDSSKYRYLIQEILTADEVLEKSSKHKSRKDNLDEPVVNDKNAIVTSANKVTKTPTKVLTAVKEPPKQIQPKSNSSQKKRKSVESEDELIDTDEEKNKSKFDDDNDESEVDWNSTDSEDEKDSPTIGKLKSKKANSSVPTTPKLATTRSSSTGSSSSTTKATDEKKKKTSAFTPSYAPTPTPTSPLRSSKRSKPSSPGHEGRTDWDATDEEIISTTEVKKVDTSIFSASLGVVHSQLKSLGGLLDKTTTNPPQKPTNQNNRSSNSSSFNASYNSVVLSQNAIDDILNSLDLIKTGCDRLSRAIKENASSIL